MANTAVLQSASPLRLVYLLTGDGTVAGPALSSSLLLSACPNGPLRTLLDTPVADQAAARVAMLAAPVNCRVTLMATPVDTTAETNQVVVDANVDAGNGNRPQLILGMSDTTGQVAMLVIEYTKTDDR